MFEVMVKEIAKKELGKMSVEVLEKRKSLNPCFKTGLRPNEGVFKSMRFDGTDKPKGLNFEQKNLIAKETGWSKEIIKHIDNMDQYAIYKKAGLHEAEINGRKCLVKDIDLNYVDPKTGMTNRELMAAGRSPYDAATGEKIELHHMGQNYDSPLAELCENSEHGDGNHDVLHPDKTDSWRNNKELCNQYNNHDKPEHWKDRV